MFPKHLLAAGEPLGPQAINGAVVKNEAKRSAAWKMEKKNGDHKRWWQNISRKVSRKISRKNSRNLKKCLKYIRWKITNSGFFCSSRGLNLTTKAVGCSLTPKTKRPSKVLKKITVNSFRFNSNDLFEINLMLRRKMHYLMYGRMLNYLFPGGGEILGNKWTKEIRMCIWYIIYIISDVSGYLTLFNQKHNLSPACSASSDPFHHISLFCTFWRVFFFRAPGGGCASIQASALSWVLPSQQASDVLVS